MSFFSPSAILQHLQEYIPRVSDRFSDDNTVSDEILAGDPKILRVTDPGHGLSAGRLVVFTEGTISTSITGAQLFTDPEGDVLSYYVEWGDGNNTGWTEYYDSGEEIILSHTWEEKKLFNIIRCRAKDNDGGISDWSKTWVPINVGTVQLPVLRFIEHLPVLYWLLYSFRGRK